MERLTIPDEHIEGGMRRAIIDARSVKKVAMTLYWALKKYEDTGLTPDEIMDGKLLSGWIPVEERLPEDSKYILLSFSNFSLLMVGRYEKDEEGGAFYLGDCDEEDTCAANDLFVNAWIPLPEPYRREDRPAAERCMEIIKNATTYVEPPTYDVDKMVEQLDKASDCYESNDQGREHIRMVDLTEAIEIVKAGGMK